MNRPTVMQRKGGGERRSAVVQRKLAETHDWTAHVEGTTKGGSTSVLAQVDDGQFYTAVICYDKQLTHQWAAAFSSDIPLIIGAILLQGVPRKGGHAKVLEYLTQHQTPPTKDAWYYGFGFKVHPSGKYVEVMYKSGQVNLVGVVKSDGRIGDNWTFADPVPEHISRLYKPEHPGRKDIALITSDYLRQQLKAAVAKQLPSGWTAR